MGNGLAEVGENILGKQSGRKEKPSFNHPCTSVHMHAHTQDAYALLFMHRHNSLF